MGVYSDRLKKGVLDTNQIKRGGVLGTGQARKKGGLRHGSGQKRGVFTAGHTCTGHIFFLLTSGIVFRTHLGFM